MLRGTNGSCLVLADLAISLAAAAGYDVLEAPASTLDEFLAQGGTVRELRPKLKLESLSLRIHSIDCIDNIDMPEGLEGGA